MKKFLLFTIVVIQLSCNTNKKEQPKTSTNLVADKDSISLSNRENNIALVRPIIENEFIKKAKGEGYELRVEGDFFRCTCESEGNNGIYFDEKTQEECMHSLNRNQIYFPEVPIIKKDIDDDGDIDFIVNYTLETTGTIYANFDCVITNENGKFIYKLKK